MAARRIDALYCTRETAEAVVKATQQETLRRAAEVKEEVASVIAERIQALQQRQEELLGMVDQLSSSKTQALEEQLAEIQSGVAAPATPEGYDAPVDPNLFFLRADAVFNFKIGEGDFLESIARLGLVGDSSTYASRSYAKGPALSVLKAGNQSYLWVYTCDKDGRRRAEGGDSVVVSLSHPEEFSELQVEDAKDGRYKVVVVPSTPGEYTMRIAVGAPGAEEEIAGGTFALEVCPPTDYLTLGLEPHGRGKLCGASGSSQPGSVRHPSGLCFDQSGKFALIVDQSNNRVQVFGIPDMQVVCCFGKKGLVGGCFDSPCDICVDTENRVVVSDLLNHRVQVLEFNPRTLTLAHVQNIGQKGTGPGQFQFPKGVSITEHGHLVVCDSGNHRIQVFSIADGFSLVRVVGCQGTGDGLFNSPLAVTSNCAGELLVSDANNRIQVFDASGTFVRCFGSKGRKDCMFNYPTSMYVNDENVLFVCDQANHRVQVLSAADGSFIHKWGGSKKKPAAGEEEAAAEAAEGEDGGEPKVEWIGLRSPAGVAMSPSGLVLVSDFQDNEIYVF
jgi:DNA-binding beta-propeller fold protein YncE